ncbi:hypothetical protein JXA40_01855 [bacterium]|nr:hypothetical protein [candidate division CSSED10-310 bacterium]
MNPEDTITLTEAAFKLGIPKHEIIYLCEKQVIVPVVDARGRGSSRLFSTQNVFELLLTLELKKYSISTHNITVLVRLLSKFSSIVEQKFGESLLDQLTKQNLQFFLVIRNGKLAYFRMLIPGKSGKEIDEKILLGLDLEKLEEYFRKKLMSKSQNRASGWRTLAPAVLYGIPDDIIVTGELIRDDAVTSQLEINLTELTKNSQF